MSGHSDSYRAGPVMRPVGLARLMDGPTLLILAMVVYLAAALFQLGLPGLFYDEALDAIPAIQFLNGRPLDITASLHLFGRDWPLMVMTYVGPTTTYLALPVFALFGVTVEALRLTNVALGALSLLLAWGFLRDFAGPRVAGVATLLLAANPTFIFWSRMGAFVSLPMLPLAIGAVWALFRWREAGRDRDLVVAAFCLGLGLTTKILFLWVWVALGVAWLLLSPALERDAGRHRWLWPLRRLNVTSAIAGTGALLLGLAPLLIFNLRGFETVATVLNNAGQTSLYGVNNLNLLANARTVIAEDLRTLIDGTWFAHAFGAAHRNPLAIPALATSVAALGYLALRDRLPYRRNRLAFLLIWLVAITLQSAITISSLGAMHLMILWPVPQALTAMALVALPEFAAPSRRTALTAVAILLAVAAIGAEAWTTVRYHRTLAATGGVGSFSAAINELNADLLAAGVEQPIALDWGFRRSLQFLSRGAINTEERFEYTQTPGDDFTAWANDRADREARGLTSPATYLFHTPQYSAFAGHWPLFEESAYRYGMTPVAQKTYTLSDGSPVFGSYRLAPAATLTVLPSGATPVEAQVGDAIRLIGYEPPRMVVRPGDILTMTLYWQADAPPPVDYKVFAHLLGTDGRGAGQHDGVPRLWGHPTMQWQAGEIVADRIKIAIAPNAEPGPYRIFIGMYDQATGQRAPLVFNGARLEGDTLGLLDVTITR